MKKAFTFIEMLIYIGLVSVFLVILSGMFGAILDMQMESRAGSAVDQDAQYLLARMEYDLHRASSVTTPATIGETTDSLALVIDGETYSYSTIGSKLELTVAGQSHILNSFDCLTSGFSVTRLGYDTEKPGIRISLDLQSVAVSLTQQAQTRSYQTTIGLR